MLKNNINPKITGMLIRIIHMFAPFIFIHILIFYSHKYVIFILSALCIIFIQFILFNGCSLTIIEDEFCKDNFTIIDPYLEFNNIKVTNYNRYLYSLVIASKFLILVGIIYYIRFIHL
jgi:hypothetical protein